MVDGHIDITTMIRLFRTGRCGINTYNGCWKMVTTSWLTCPNMKWHSAF